MSVHKTNNNLAIRWTVGDVRPRGFELLRLSIACAFRLFGPAAQYLVCVNSLPLEAARERTGQLPVRVDWRTVTRNDLPPVLGPYLDEGVIEGMGWKLVPLRVCPAAYELAIDNDCLIWALPQGMQAWLKSGNGGLFAEDVDRCLGSFDDLCIPGNLNAGIRGLPPDLDLRDQLQFVLQAAARATGGHFQLSSEIEEQGLQAAAMSRLSPLFLVRNTEVTICSPFWPRSPELGSCGAHFVGMNAPHIPWNYFDRPADEWLEEHWQRHRPALYEKAGLAFE